MFEDVIVYFEGKPVVFGSEKTRMINKGIT